MEIFSLSGCPKGDGSIGYCDLHIVAAEHSGRAGGQLNYTINLHQNSGAGWGVITKDQVVAPYGAATTVCRKLVIGWHYMIKGWLWSRGYSIEKINKHISAG